MLLIYFSPSLKFFHAIAIHSFKRVKNYLHVNNMNENIWRSIHFIAHFLLQVVRYEGQY